MLLMEVNGLEKSIKDRILIKQTEPLHIYKGDKIGIVGVNGTGKSVFMKILAGEGVPDKGAVKNYGKVSFAPQLEDEESDLSGKSEEKWSIQGRAHETMSGGERTRAKIAAALQTSPDVLLLDEPTSHLDLEGIQQLEKELLAFKGAVLIIAHDRALLDNVCTSILELEDAAFTEYNGNYSDYLVQKEMKRNRQQAEYEEYVKEKQRLQAAAQEKAMKVKTMKKKPSRMSMKEANLGKGKVQSKKKSMDKTVKAIEKRIEMLDKKEKPRGKDAVIFDVQQFPAIHSKAVVTVKDLDKAFGERILYDGLSFTIPLGCKAAIAGKNGAGKSTLLQMIADGENPAINLSKVSKIGYFRQDLKILNEEKNILENVMESSPYTEEFIRTVLARLLFKRDEVYKKINVLSGGERVKSALAKLFLGNYNVLLLDEPTNYLDIFTREALEEVLKSYPGTILFATHDRHLMDQVATHTLSIENKQGVFFEGSPYGQPTLKTENLSTNSAQSEQELMLLELELTDVIGRLSMLQKGVNKEELELRYQELLREIQQCRQRNA